MKEKSQLALPKIVVLKNDQLKVKIIPELGSNIISIIDKKKNVELLNSPHVAINENNKNCVYGTSVLFPPGRMQDAMFYFNNKQYSVATNESKDYEGYGLLYNKKWTITQYNKLENLLITQFDSCEHSDIPQHFSNHFSLIMAVSLEGSTIKQVITIINKSTEIMPIGLGIRPVFYFDSEYSTLKMDIDSEWVLNPSKLPTGEMVDLLFKDELKKGAPINRFRFDNIYPISSSPFAEIIHSHLGTRVCLRVGEGFMNWIINKPNETDKFLSIQPCTWLSNAPNLNIPSEKTGMDSLVPGQEKSYAVTWDVGHL